MSGSGGFYKYRCVYWNVRGVECQQWNLVNNVPCNSCLVAGRNGRELASHMTAWQPPREIGVPCILEDGFLHYVTMDVIFTGDPENPWDLREKAPAEPPATTMPATSDVHRPGHPTTGHDPASY